MPNDKIRITLERARRPMTQDSEYTMTKITGAVTARIWEHNKRSREFRVSDTMSEEDARKLVSDALYSVTVVPEPAPR